jgi:hypothetical protein
LTLFFRCVCVCVVRATQTVVDHLSTLENLLAAEYVRCKAAQIYALLGPALADQLATPFSAPPGTPPPRLSLPPPPSSA